MTREEAIKTLKWYVEDAGINYTDFTEAFEMAIAALRSVSREQELEAENKELKERIVNWRKYMAPTREQVEKVWRGEWNDIKPGVLKLNISWVCRCAKCGCPQDYKHNFCPNCGAPMTDEAVDMVMERLEKVKDNTVQA